MSHLSINHLSNQDLAYIFQFLATNDLQLVSRRWMNICTIYFPKRYHMMLENVTLSSHSGPVQVFKSSKKYFESLTINNVELDFSSNSNFSEVLLFLKRLQRTVTALTLEFSTKPNIDLIRGFRRVERLEITSPGWYVEIANNEISFPEVRVLKLRDFSIEIFGKNMFCSFFKKFSYVEEIQIEGNVLQNFSRFGTYFGKKLTQVHLDIDDDRLAAKTMEFLTIVKGIELHELTFVIRSPYDVEIFDRIAMVHATLKDIKIISMHGYFPLPYPNIRSCEIILQEERMDVFNALDLFSGLKSIVVRFPWKLNHVQINCFFGHNVLGVHSRVMGLSLGGFNKNCVTCFSNMTATYPNLRVFEYTSATQIDLEIIQVIGKNLPHLQELILAYKQYDKSWNPGFASYFEQWPEMLQLKKIKLEPISWQWTTEGLLNLCKCCPLLENVNFDGNADIDENFLKPIMTQLRFLQQLSVGDIAARRPSVLLNMDFLFSNDVAQEQQNGLELFENFQQPCPRLKELRLLTCSLDLSFKLNLFQHFKALRVVQDRKTLLTAREFHEMQDNFQQETNKKCSSKGPTRGNKVKKLIQSCFCLLRKK